MVSQNDHRKIGIASGIPYNMCHIIAFTYKNGKVIKKISDEKYVYQREGSA